MKIQSIIALLMFSAPVMAAPLDYKFLHALNMVEASGRQGNIVGDHGKALGGYQIHQAFWADAIKFDKSIGGSYNDVTNKVYAEKIVTAYLNRYASDAIRLHDYRTLAYKFHHGKDNAAYWFKVENYID
jgi:hypothetical protein